MKALISCLLLIHAVVSAGVPFFDLKGEEMAQKLFRPPPSLGLHRNKRKKMAFLIKVDQPHGPFL